MPEQHRAGQAKSKPAGPAARKAWQALMNHEVTKLRLDLLQHLAALMKKCETCTFSFQARGVEVGRVVHERDDTYTIPHVCDYLIMIRVL